MRKAALLVGLLMAAAALSAETYMLLVETSLDGEADAGPPAALEGLMSAMFDAGHVSFDCGPYRPLVDWQNLQFREPLEIALEGGAHYLATVRLAVGTLAPQEGRPQAFGLQARFQLWDPRGGSLLGEGGLALDNLGREEELSLEALLFRAGELAAGELQRIAARR
jgi:hypothetical protein